MKRIELVVVPIEEAVRFLTLGDEAHLRLALLLLDSTAELLMHRECEHELHWLKMYSDLVDRHQQMNEQLREHGQPEHPEDEFITEARAKLVSKRRRQKIEREFNTKAQFLVERDNLDASFVRVLSKLHRYRNDAYHRDTLRPKTLLSSVQIYVYLISQMMRTLKPHMMGYPSEVPPGLREYLTDHDDPEATLTRTAGRASFDLQGDIGDALLRKADLITHDLAPVLSTHLKDRLEELDEALGWAAGTMSPPGQEECTEEAAWYLVQLPLGLPIGRMTTADVIEYSNPDRVDYAEIAGWRQRAVDLADVTDRVEAFTLFADIEDELEPTEEKVHELCRILDEQIQLEIDIARGK